MPYPKIDPAIRFEKFIDKSLEHNGCWIWIGAKSGGRYGTFSLSHHNQIGAHVFALEAALGRKLMPGMQALHSCDVRECVNADHLFEGTCLDNVRDKINKRRGIFGDRHPMAKLSESDVIAIRKKHSEGASHSALAASYGVTRSSVGKICRRLTWSYLSPT